MAQKNLTGKTVLGYTVTEKLGSGAFGTVYKAEKTNVAGSFIRALKHITIPSEKEYYSVLNSMGGDASKADNYFSHMLGGIVSEIRILSELSEKGGQNIVRYYENDVIVSENPKRYDIYILMEYLTPLEKFCHKTDFRVRDVLRLGLDILSALQLCHENGVIHRDVKDDNIFVSAAGQYKIGDFGVSKVLKDSSRAESLKGTPNFLAPEVYLGKEGYTKSVDLYSLGIVLYRLLNYYRNPFLPPYPEQYFSRDEETAFEKRMRGAVPELPLLGGEAVGRVIVKAISGKSERFQSASEFREALEAAIDRTPAEVFDQKVMYSISDIPEQEIRDREFKATIAEKNSWDSEQKEEKYSGELNKYLFQSAVEEQKYNQGDDEEGTAETEKNSEKEKETSNRNENNGFPEDNIQNPNFNQKDTDFYLNRKLYPEKERIQGIGIDLGYSDTRVTVIVNKELLLLEDDCGNSEFPSVVPFFTSEKNADLSYKSCSTSYVKIWDLLLLPKDKYTNLVENQLVYYFQNLFRYKNIKFNHNLSAVVALPVAVIGTGIPDRVKKAAEKAGIICSRIISAGCAQAINQIYPLSFKIDTNALFISCGDRYLNITYTEISDGVLDVIKENGFENCSGSVLDRGIASIATLKLSVNDQKKITQNEQISQLVLKEAKKVKHELSYRSVTAFNYPECLENESIKITQNDLNELMKPITGEIIKFSKTINKKESIPVFVTGKTMKNPLLQEVLKNTFGYSQFFDFDNYSIAKGASLYSHLIAHPSTKFLLLESIPFSIIIEIDKDEILKIVPEGTTIPVSKTESFHLASHTFKNMRITISGKKDNNQDFSRDFLVFTVDDSFSKPNSSFIDLSIAINANHKMTVKIGDGNKDNRLEQSIYLW